REPARDALLDPVLEVEPELLVEVALDAPAAEDRLQSQRRRVPPVLDLHGRALARIIRDHPAEARASLCARPVWMRWTKREPRDTLPATEICVEARKRDDGDATVHRRGAMTTHRRKRSERRPESIMNNAG